MSRFWSIVMVVLVLGVALIGIAIGYFLNMTVENQLIFKEYFADGRSTKMMCIYIFSLMAVGMFFWQGAKVSKLMLLLVCFGMLIFTENFSLYVPDTDVSKVSGYVILTVEKFWATGKVAFEEAYRDWQQLWKAEETKSVPQPPQTAPPAEAEPADLEEKIPKIANFGLSKVRLRCIGPNTEQSEFAFLSYFQNSLHVKPITIKMLEEFREVQSYYALHSRWLVEDDADREDKAILLERAKLKPIDNGKVEPILKTEQSEKDLAKLRQFFASVPFKGS